MDPRMNRIDLRALRPKGIWDLSAGFYGRDREGRELSCTNYYMRMDGRPFFGISGEIHYSRLWEEYWEDELIKMKNGGVNIIAFYVFWIHHEEEEGVFDFTGRRNLRGFVELCAKHGLYAIARIGPFCHGEVRNGGIPDWIYGKPCEARSLDGAFLLYVERLYRRIGKELEGLFYQDGGPVIAAQLDNEYMSSSAPWEQTVGISNERVPAGKDGNAYLLRLRDLAREAGIRVPLYTCTGWGPNPAPEGFLPLWGGYAYQPWLFYPYNAAGPPEHPPSGNYRYRDRHNRDREASWGFPVPYDPEARPYFCCEMGGGMNCAYHYRFRLAFESVDALANVQLGSGCNLLGYYMYHGGANPRGSRAEFLNENEMPKVSYDFQAPLGEYGQVRDSYHRLRVLHLLVKSFEGLLCTCGTVLPEGAEDIAPEDTGTLRYAVRVSPEGSGFLFINNFQDHVVNTPVSGQSVSLDLPGPAPGGGEGPRTLTFPGISLEAGENGIFPFNLDLGGVRLRWATAQPLTVLERDGGTWAFFFSPAGTESVYCFEGPVELEPEYGAPRFDGTTVIPGGDGPVMFRVRSGSRELRVVHMTRRQSLELYRLELDGGPVLLLSSGTVISSLGKCRLEHDEPGLDLALFPPEIPLPVDLWNARAERCGNLGPFARYRISQAPVSYGVSVREIGAHRYRVDIPRWDTGTVKDIILKLEYQGDIGHAFIDGRMIADHFWNGAPWELGLREFTPHIWEQPLTIYITPLAEGRTLGADGPGGRREEAAGPAGRVGRITARIIYYL
jgi:hypothetical protein